MNIARMARFTAAEYSLHAETKIFHSIAVLAGVHSDFVKNVAKESGSELCITWSPSAASTGLLLDSC
jgi:hypothetical protein